ncbi:cation transporter [Amycolatopsis rhizosphaerae]|uniref:Cation transporter n=1 Tax=Amycolatopsis rhizosphaerae TaxID=2053003 RepID=A0A558DJM2_9PSEU|nr:cation transporter [Amycolatopsis rhizosphaerae]TVT61210.1 cation transporter [Amycolatopsis rhizosphaerae]
MSGVPDLRNPAARRAVHLAWFTIGYNLAEAAVAITAGLVAGAVSLTGFGLDSCIEVASAAMVLTRLRSEIRGGRVDERRERRALRFIAITFFVLAAYVTAQGIVDLVVGTRPDTSLAGIVLTGASIAVMPLLARAKHRAGLAMNSRLVVADAAETRLCAWLSVSTCAGLIAYAFAGWTWLDPIAGFVIALFALREGREAWEGELVCED